VSSSQSKNTSLGVIEVQGRKQTSVPIADELAAAEN